MSDLAPEFMVDPMGWVMHSTKNILIALVVIAVIVLLILWIAGVFTSHSSSGFLQGPPTGVLTYPLGQFGVQWGVGTTAAFQGSGATGGLFETDNMTVQQLAFERESPSKNAALCGPGKYYAEMIAYRADDGTAQKIGACLPEGSTLINPASAPTPAAPSASGFKGARRAYTKQNMGRKSGFSSAPNVCSDMWGWDADSELGTQVSLTNFGPERGPDENKFQSELEALE